MSFELTDAEKRKLRKCEFGVFAKSCGFNYGGYCIDEDHAVSGLCPMAEESLEDLKDN